MKTSHRTVFSLVVTLLLLLAWTGGTSDNQSGAATNISDNDNVSKPTATSPQKTSLSELYTIACTETKLARCTLADLAFDDATRTVSAGRNIVGRRLLVGIPNELQISPLDALRDPRISKIFERRPSLAGDDGEYKPPSSAAYLALFLVLESRRFRDSSGDSDSPKDKVHRAYFGYLPTLDDLMDYHPVAKRVLGGKNEETQEEEGRRGTSSFVPFLDQNVEATSRTLRDEYEAFSEASNHFEDLGGVSLEDFVWGKLVVGTRVFHNRAVSGDDDDNNISGEELERILPHLADKSLDSAMRPLLDAFNDHNQRNLGWIDGWKGKDNNDNQKHSVIFSRDSIAAGTELFLSYREDKSDYHKLSQYGFINADGSEHSIASLAPYHRPFLEPRGGGESSSSSEVWLRYLGFADGYRELSPGTNPGVVESFRRVQSAALQKILYNPGYWGMTVPASTTEELPAVSDALLTTCRLLALTHRDYDGAAAQLLGLQLGGVGVFDGIVLAPSENGGDALEYRAYHVLERLAMETFGTLLETLAPLASSPHASNIEVDVWRRFDERQFGSAEGLRAYVLLRELESLRKVMALARKQKAVYLERRQKKIESGEEANDEDYIVRTEPFPSLAQQSQ